MKHKWVYYLDVDFTQKHQVHKREWNNVMVIFNQNKKSIENGMFFTHCLCGYI